MKVAAVIPTMNEDPHRLCHLVRSLDEFCDSVIVADHSEIAPVRVHEAGAFVLKVAEPGFDAAYKRAWKMIPRDWYVAHIDAGGSHDPNDLVKMIDVAANDPFDIVIGSRFTKGGEHFGPWRRRVTSRLASTALNTIALSDIKDWTSGLRVYSPKARSALSLYDATTTGHAWQIESLWMARQFGCRITEHPITYLPSPSSLTAKRVREANRLYWRLAFQ